MRLRQTFCEFTRLREVGQKKKPVIAWETITGLRGGEGRNYISRELWELERLTLNNTTCSSPSSTFIWIFYRIFIRALAIVNQALRLEISQIFPPYRCFRPL